MAAAKLAAAFRGRMGRKVAQGEKRKADAKLREQQADLWLGFDPGELAGLARDAGLTRPVVRPLPHGVRGEGPDAHVGWQVLVATRPAQDA
jgi:hypothetical protein